MAESDILFFFFILQKHYYFFSLCVYINKSRLFTVMHYTINDKIKNKNKKDNK